MSNLVKNSVQKVEISDKSSGQRLDNFLRKILNGVPNSLIYKIIRDGQVRVNSKRVTPMYRIETNDVIRIPPVSTHTKSTSIAKNLTFNLKKIILFENEDFIIIDKPSGISVQPGTKISTDLIGIVKSHEGYENSALVHRLDKGTSGLMILGKNYQSTSDLGKIFISKKVSKAYYALLAGITEQKLFAINSPLLRSSSNNSKKIIVDEDGKSSSTTIELVQQFKDSFLARIKINTGRMHQIRVHSSSIGHPICGDTEYGNRDINEKFRKLGLKRIFLHSCMIKFDYKRKYSFTNSLPDDLESVVNKLKNAL